LNVLKQICEIIVSNSTMQDLSSTVIQAFKFSVMEPTDSLPSSQKLSIGSYPELV
jgi:hypothetical protein